MGSASSRDVGVRLTFVVNHAAFFVSHRLPIAEAALRLGWSVDLLTGQAGNPLMEAEAIARLGLTSVRHRRFAFGASSLNPLTEFVGFLGIVIRFFWWRPDIVHCASPKGLLYGGIAARLAGVPSVVLAVSGMGYAFTDEARGGWRRGLLRAAYRRLIKISYGHSNKVVVVQNEDDRRWILDEGMAADSEIRLIPGSGVDMEDFARMDGSAKLPLVLLPARLLVDKGVLEFVEAVRMIKEQTADWSFVLAGAADYRNPSSIAEELIKSWVAEGIVEWKGHVSNMVPLFQQASVVCLPSYREGMPKSLLEAAAAGCAVVTTDTTGCREAIVAGETGDLVPVRDAGALASALLSLIQDRSRRERYAASGKILAARKFGLQAVIADMFSIYGSLRQRVDGCEND